MPQMDGLEFSVRAKEMLPDKKPLGDTAARLPIYEIMVTFQESTFSSILTAMLNL